MSHRCRSPLLRQYVDGVLSDVALLLQEVTYYNLVAYHALMRQGTLERFIVSLKVQNKVVENYVVEVDGLVCHMLSILSFVLIE